MTQLNIGDTVCDMYDVTLRVGEVIDTPYTSGSTFVITKFIQIETENASEMLDVLTAPAKITNKIAVVVGETCHGGYKCAYSYDGRRFGLFEIEPA